MDCVFTALKYPRILVVDGDADQGPFSESQTVGAGSRVCASQLQLLYNDLSINLSPLFHREKVFTDNKIKYTLLKYVSSQFVLQLSTLITSLLYN